MEAKVKPTVIHIGDGRYVHHEEGALFRPPPAPRKIDPKWQWKRNFKKSEPAPPSFTKPTVLGDNHPIRRRILELPGYKEFVAYFRAITHKYGDIGRKVGHVPGYRQKDMERILEQAKEQVKKDMENIKKANPDLDAMAEEALEGALSVLRAPTNQQSKLAAAKLLLDFTKSKPVAKSEVSVNAAEAWLSSLGKDDDA